MHVGTKWYFITLLFFLSVQGHSRALGEDFFVKIKTQPKLYFICTPEM